MLRRHFLGALTAPALSLRADSPKIKLGFDTYSVRALQWKAPQLLDYAIRLKVDTVQISSIGLFESLEPAYLAKIKDRAAQAGISLEGGIGCICPAAKAWNAAMGDPAANVAQGLKVAKAIGSPVLRCFMGSSEDRLTGNLPAAMESTVKVFRSVRSQALDIGVKIALENHSGDMQAREVRTVIEESGKEFVGVCLDTGNSVWSIENPLVTLDVLAPYVVTTHVRDALVYEEPQGAAGQWVNVGQGNLPLVEFFERFRQVCPHSSVQLEILSGRVPRAFPYLEEGFWKYYRNTPASEFARFVALAKSGAGRSPLPALNAPQTGQQQQQDLEASLTACREKLGLGVR